MRIRLSMLMLIVLCGLLAIVGHNSVQDTSAQSLSDDLAQNGQEKSFQELWGSAPVPTEHAYRADEKKRQQFEQGFRHGFTWSFGDTPFCPTNPSESNQPVSHGWIEGWKAGVKAGGTNGLPSKYSSFIAWQAP